MTLAPIAQIAAFAVFAFIALAGALGMATTMSMFRSAIFLMGSFIGVAGLFILLAADLIGLLQVMMYIGGMLVMVLFMVLFMHDPGGAMMADMEMAPIEKFFSLGIPAMNGHGGHGAMQHDQHDDDAEADNQAHGNQAHGNNGHDADHEHTAAHGGEGQVNGQHEAAAAEQSSADQMQHDDDMGGMMDMSMTTPIKRLAALLAVIAGVGLVALLLLRPAWPVVNAQPNPNSAQQVGNLLMSKYMLAFEGAGLLILLGIFSAVFLAQPGKHPDDASRAAHVAHDEPPVAAPEQPFAPLREAELRPEEEVSVNEAYDTARH